MTNSELDRLIITKAVAKGYPIKTAQIITAQARLESADYSSNVFKLNNNLFGYKYVGQSLAFQGSQVPGSELQTGPRYYAKYNSVEDSIKELFNWIDRRISGGQFYLNDLTSPVNYANAFGKSPYKFYGISPANYASGLDAKLNKIDLTFNPSTGTTNQNSSIIIFVSLVALYFIAKPYLSNTKA